MDSGPKGDKSSFSFEQALCHFVHYSSALVHLDISGMGMTPEQSEYILANGLRKSRTLMACHANGLALSEKSVQAILKIDEVNRDRRAPTKWEKLKYLECSLKNQNLQEQVVLQRILGRPEMPQSHRWQWANQCGICNKSSLYVVVWNRHLCREFEEVAVSSKAENSPTLLVANSSATRMLPLSEYLERLETLSQSNVRACDNELEQKRYEN